MHRRFYFCLGLAIATASAFPALGQAQTILVDGFEAGPVNPFPGYGPITGWTSTTPISGTDDAAGPFNNGLAIPQGSRIGFVQGAGTIERSVSGFIPGATYVVDYFENERGSDPSAIAIGSTTLGGVTVDAPHNVVRTDAYRRQISSAFTATSGTQNLAMTNNFGGVGDNTLLLDSVVVRRAAPTPINHGFEDYAIAPETFEYGPNGQPNVGWSFTGGAGVSRNGSGFQGNPTFEPPSSVAKAIEGNQIGYIQGWGDIAQTLSGFEVGATYSLYWIEQMRLNAPGANNLDVLLNGVSVTGGARSIGNTSWAAQNRTFIADSSTYTLTFRGLGAGGADVTTFIDDVVTYYLDPNNAPTANAGGGYFFFSLGLISPSITLNGSASTDPENQALSYAWSDSSGLIGTSMNQSFAFADTLLSFPGDSQSVTLAVTDLGGLTSTDTEILNYLNTTPGIVAASATPTLGGFDFVGQFSDLDFIANIYKPGFEVVTWEFDSTPGGIVGNGFFTGSDDEAITTNGFFSNTALLGVFGGPGTHTVFVNLLDRGGAITTTSFQITVVPEVGTLTLGGVAVALLTGLALRKRLRRS